MKTPGVRYPRGMISWVARHVGESLRPHVERLCYAGSFRRGLPTLGDLDVLVIPTDYNSRAVSRAFAAVCVDGELESGSGSGLDIGTVLWTSHGGARGIAHIPVNVFYTTAENWGAALLYTTGSRDYNVASRAWARSRGYRLTQDGVWDRRTGARIPDSGFSERAALRVIGLPWLPPNRRTGSCFGVERTTPMRYDPP